MFKPKPSAIIKKAADILIAHEWVQNALALDKDGNRVMPDSKKAHSLDLVGCLYKASGSLKFPKEVGEIIGGMTPNGQYWSSYYCASFNDDLKTTKKDVLALLDISYIIALQIERTDPGDVL